MPTQEGKGRGVGLLGKKRVMLTVTGGWGVVLQDGRSAHCCVFDDSGFWMNACVLVFVYETEIRRQNS